MKEILSELEITSVVPMTKEMDEQKPSFIIQGSTVDILRDVQRVIEGRDRIVDAILSDYTNVFILITTSQSMRKISERYKDSEELGVIETVFTVTCHSMLKMCELRASTAEEHFNALNAKINYMQNMNGGMTVLNNSQN